MLTTFNKGKPTLIWASLNEDGTPPNFKSEEFPGTVEQAANEMRSRADRGEFLIGQVLASDGKVMGTFAGAPSAELAF